MDTSLYNVPVLGAAAVLLIAGYLVLRKRRRTKADIADQAARAFREKVLAELEGLYPVPRAWNSGAYDRFKGTIPAIESAAAKFRSFIPAGKRDSFDAALKEYSVHCSRITWQSCATFGVIPEMKKTEDIGPKEVFRQNVNTLLSFAKDS